MHVGGYNVVHYDPLMNLYILSMVFKWSGGFLDTVQLSTEPHKEMGHLYGATVLFKPAIFSTFLALMTF